jgi:hypothetical protein
LRVDGIVSANKYDLVPATYSSVSLTFTLNVAVTSVLSADTTVLFWFYGSYTQLYLDVETAPGSGTYIPNFRVNTTTVVAGSVIVPKGCRVTITISSSGGATGYFRKFGIS